MVLSSAPFLLFALFLILVMLSGGASRADAQSQLVVRVGSIILGFGGLMLADRSFIREYRAVLLFLLALAALMAIQLVPLPPEIWTQLPGRELFSQAAPLAGMEQPWRPISVTPDLTINSLLSLLPAAAAIPLFAQLGRQHWFFALLLMGGLVLISGIVGLAQVSGKGDALYIYRITNLETAVGLFANRNHQALLLSTIFPLLVALVIFPDSPISGNKPVQYSVVGLAFFFLPLILVTGSRAGLVLSLVGIVAAALLYLSRPSERPHGGRSALFSKKWLWVLAVGAAFLLVFLTISLSRAEAVQRIFSQDIAQEKRYLLFAPMTVIASSYFPVGAGFGSFADIFRIHEPFSNLSLTYLNHAHNDLIELAIEAGAAGLLLLLAFLIWLVGKTYHLWRTPIERGRHVLMGRLGTINLFIILLASLADYPIRTPIVSVLFAISCCWLVLPNQTGGPRAGSSTLRKSGRF